MNFDIIDYFLIWHAIGMIISYIGAKFIDPTDFESPSDFYAIIGLGYLGLINIPLWIAVFIHVREEAREIREFDERHRTSEGNVSELSARKRVGEAAQPAAAYDVEKMLFEGKELLKKITEEEKKLKEVISFEF